MNIKIVLFLFPLFIACNTEDTRLVGDSLKCDTVFIETKAEITPIVKKLVLQK